MSFLAPYLLWGTLTAGIPIALHFFYRSRYRNLPWAAMKFLLTALEQTSRRLRFQELLLLLLRVALLVLLALALARPSTSTAGRGGQGDAVDAVLLVDTSMSMGAQTGVAPVSGQDPYAQALRRFAEENGSLTALDRARAAGLAILAGLPRQSTVQIVKVTNHATLLGPNTPSHLDQAAQILEQMQISELSTDYLPGIKLAGELLDRGPSPNKEVYLLGDLQRMGFDTQSSAMTRAIEELRQRASLHLIQCRTKDIGNVALLDITPQSPLRTGERADFAVLVRNTSKLVLRNLTVTLEIDGKSGERDSQSLVEIGPGETRAVPLSAHLDRPGRHVLTAKVSRDDLPGDNRFDQVIHVNDRIGILLIDGTATREPRQSGSYFLQHALNPSRPEEKTGLPVTVLTPDRAAPRDLGGKELCLLVNVRLEPSAKQPGGFLSPEFTRALAAFVQEGKSLIFFAGHQVDPEGYNRVLFEQLRLLPYRIGKIASAPTNRPWTIDRKATEDLPYRRFQDEQGYAMLDRIEVRRLLDLETTSNEAKGLTEESRVLLRYQGGIPAVASRKRPGQGEVLLFTTSIHDPAWSDWYVSPAFVPFIQVTLDHLLESRPARFNRVAGEPLIWQVGTEQATTAFDLLGPHNDHHRLGYPQGVRGRLLLTTEPITRAGLYRISTVTAREDTEATPLFAVTPDLSETEDLECLQPDPLQIRFGPGLTYLVAGDDGAIFSGAERLRREWTTWLLVLLLVLVVGEMLFAWYCGRSW